MTRRRAQRRLRRYADLVFGPTWRDLDDGPRYDPAAPLPKPAVPRPPYEALPQRPPMTKPPKEAA